MAISSKTKQFDVPAHFSGLRLDQALSALACISRTRAASLIRAGRAGIGGKEKVAPSLRLVGGERVFAEIDTVEAHVEPVEMEVDVIYEDGHVAVVCKPAGLPVHPAPSVSGPTLVSGLLSRWPQMQGVGEADRPGIVHRLDQDVSGLMVVALDPQAYASLLSAFSSRRVSRRYLALVAGVLEADTGRIEGPIGRDPSDPMKRAVVLGGKPAATNYTRLAYWDFCSLTEVGLETGRTHQIRVHMEAIGHPICGDPIYGRRFRIPKGRCVPERLRGLERPFLHAFHLEFEHPSSAHRLRFESPLPSELRDVLESLGAPVFGSAQAVLG